MTAQETCSWLSHASSGYACRLRNQVLPVAEVTGKCSKIEKSVLCVDAYSALTKGQEMIDAKSTDAFLWLAESATQFENLGESDNAILAIVRGIDYATNLNLTDKGYDLFRYARSIYENGHVQGDPSLKNPATKKILVKAGNDLIEQMRKSVEISDVVSMQAELKAAILGGNVELKKPEKDESKDLVISHGKSLYSKKADEYKEGASTYLKSGMIKNAVTFACLGALADLMLGRAKQGLTYLTDTADSGEKRLFHENPCFNWTKLIFKGYVSRDAEALEDAKVLFLKIPWSFKDDREFARRVMESVERRISLQD